MCSHGFRSRAAGHTIGVTYGKLTPPGFEGIGYGLQLGAKGAINRKDFKCWGQLPKVGSPEYAEWLKEMRKFGKAIWDITGKGVNVDCVFEHPGESTIAVSVQVVKRGGMVVIVTHEPETWRGTADLRLLLSAGGGWQVQPAEDTASEPEARKELADLR